MDDLRWILLAIAVLVVVIIYVFSRSRKKDNAQMRYDEDSDVPSFSADSAVENDWVDGVGPVKVLEGDNEGAEIKQHKPSFAWREQLDETDAVSDDVTNTPPEQIPVDTTPVEPEPVTAETPDPKPEEEPVAQTASSDDIAVDDVIAVYVLAAEGAPAFKGEKILSASYALHLEHGEMNIFHRHTETDDHAIQFSMANMLEPGWFDIEQMNQMETGGLSFFMQVNLVENPARVLDDMLICAHGMSTMLEAKLCNAHRKPLDEAYTNSLRDKVKRLIEIKEQAV